MNEAEPSPRHGTGEKQGKIPCNHTRRKVGKKVQCSAKRGRVGCVIQAPSGRNLVATF